MIREKLRNVRDIIYSDPGPLGMELSQPTSTEPTWRVCKTHPPVSGLGLSVGSVLIAVNGQLIDGNTDKMDIVRLMGLRPLIASVVESGYTEESLEEAWVRTVAEEITSYILLKRANSPFKTVPGKFSRLNSDEPEDPSDIWDTPLRVMNADRRLNESFLDCVNLVTPAAFAHCPEIVKNLRIEGFPLEYAFIVMVLGGKDTRNWSAIQWNRIFLTRVEEIAAHSSNLLEDAISILCSPLVVDDDLLSRASRIGLDSDWVKRWLDQEFGSIS